MVAPVSVLVHRHESHCGSSLFGVQCPSAREPHIDQTDNVWADCQGKN